MIKRKSQDPEDARKRPFFVHGGTVAFFATTGELVPKLHKFAGCPSILGVVTVPG